MKHAAATLGSGNLRSAVMLPDGEDINEWVAVNSKYVKVIESCGHLGSTLFDSLLLSWANCTYQYLISVNRL